MPADDGDFVHDADLTWEDLGGGLSRKVLAYGDALMMVRVRFEAGAVGAPHTHPHVQCTLVESGTFDVTVDGWEQRLSAGDSFRVPSGALHGVVAVTDGVLLDAFTPVREDFVAAAT